MWIIFSSDGYMVYAYLRCTLEKAATEFGLDSFPVLPEDWNRIQPKTICRQAIELDTSSYHRWVEVRTLTGTGIASNHSPVWVRVKFGTHCDRV